MAEVLESNVPGRTGSVLAQLGAASRVVDEMWREALAEGRTEEAIDLGEASQGIHRAMIVLSPHSPAPSHSGVFVVEWG
jgi:hypothetical protein